MPALWLIAVGQNQYTAVFGVCSDTYGFSAVHTDLSGLVCQALHHSKQQNACPVAGCCWAEPQNSSFGVRSDTYGFLLCIQTSVGWCAKHCITLNSKMPALWLAAGQNHKTAVLGVRSDTMGFCCAYIPQWVGVPSTASL